MIAESAEVGIDSTMQHRHGDVLNKWTFWNASVQLEKHTIIQQTKIGTGKRCAFLLRKTENIQTAPTTSYRSNNCQNSLEFLIGVRFTVSG